MKKNMIYRTLGLFLSVLVALVAVNAIADYSVTPSVYEISKQTNENGTHPITIENTGNESINITINKEDFDDGTNTLEINLSQTSIINLSPDETIVINFSYNTDYNAGTFSGAINFNSDAKNVTVDLTLEVEEGNMEGPSLMFEDEGSVLEIIAELGEEERKTFTLVNNGNETLTNIKIDLDDLDGDDDTIRVRDIEIDGDEVDDFELDELVPGDSERIRISVDVDDDIDVDDYRGDLEVEADRPNGDRYSRTFTLKVMTESDEEDVFIETFSGDVRSSELIVFAEPGDSIDDYEIVVKNDGSGRVNDLRLRVDGDLEAENSENTIPAGNIEFSPNPFDVDDRDEEDIEFLIDIPDDQPTGDYLADIELVSASGKKLDDILLRVKVIGDIYISDLDVPESVEIGENYNVAVTVKNQGNKVYRNVKITGTLFDVEYGNGDIIESSSSFILNSGDNKEIDLRFAIPDDAQDGDATLEIKVSYDGEELYELESVSIERPTNNIIIDSYGINPRVAQCDKQLFAFIKFRNLGKFDKDIKVSTEIIGTNIIQSSQTYELGVDDIDQQNMVLDISNLEGGEYKVVQKITTSGQTLRKESDFRVINCSSGSPGVDINPINNTSGNQTGNVTDNGEDKIDLFGTQIDKTKIYLGAGLIFVIALIIIGLFLV